MDPSSLPPGAPAIDPAALREIRPGIHVIEDRRVPLVPNIGIVEGTDAVLVVDAGMGPVNGATVLAAARTIAAGRPLILTLTHFHPEHAFGAQAFKGAARILYNAAQRDELAARGPGYLEMFRTFGPGVAAALEGTEIVMPDEVYHGGSHRIDLGGRVAEMRTWGLAHTAADQVVWLPDDRVLFAGDLAEERIFPIFPWFPPDDTVLDAGRWQQVLGHLRALDPAVVVPGHGGIGGAEILAAVSDYMDEVRAAVARGKAGGLAGDDLVNRLEPGIRAAHPGWDAPEWIGFALRYYAAQP